MNLDHMAGVYPQPPGLTGEDRIFGTFPDQRIFGYRCSIQVEKLPDEHCSLVDILGFYSFRVGELAIHISGLNSCGEVVGARRIEALGMYKVLWNTPDGKKPREPHSSMGGPGFDGPEPMVIVGDTLHHAMWTNCEYFVTLRGLHSLRPAGSVGDTGTALFTPSEVCKAMDKRRKNRFSSYDEPQHTRAVRRLIEDAMRCGETIDGDELIRYSRWSYRWLPL